MACEIARPSPQDLFNRYRDMFSTTVLQGGVIIPESNEWYVVSLEYAVAEEFYSFAEQQWKERDPRTACCDNLINMAAINGVFPRGATFAQGYTEITGVPGSALPAVLEINIDGDIYETVSTLPAVLPPDGRIIVRIRSTEAGSIGNGTVPDSGTIVNVPEGIIPLVTILGGRFCGGEDAEGCEQFRSRYLRRLAFAPRATDEWIQQKLLEWPCVTRVCKRGPSCCTIDSENGCNCCGQALEYHVFMDNTFACGIPPQCVLDEINEWMFGPAEQRGYGVGQVEVGVCGEILPTTPVEVDVTISDYGCISNSAKTEIRSRMQEFFRTLCPSTELKIRQLDVIVAEVLGANNDFAVEIAVSDDDLVERIGVGGCLDCGVEMKCDVIACLRNVFFIDTLNEIEDC